MVNELGFAIGASFAFIIAALHLVKGAERQQPGDITEEVSERRAASVPETDFPEPMNRSVGGGAVAPAAVGDTVGELGSDEEDAAEEEDRFDPTAIPEDEVETFEIEYRKEGQTLEVASNESLLDAGEEEGWDLPYACREGTCISCGGHILDGSANGRVVHQYNEGMLNETELDEGYVLTCSAYPTASFQLDTSEAP